MNKPIPPNHTATYLPNPVSRPATRSRYLKRAIHASIIFSVLGLLLPPARASNAAAALPYSATGHTAERASAVASDTHVAVTRQASSAALSATLSNDGPTPLGQATHLTATLSPTTALDQWRWVSSTLDSTGDVGYDNSLAIGSDGLPVMSYFDFTNRDLKVAKCGDITCTLANVVANTLDSAGSVGQFTSLAIGRDGLPVMSYRDFTNGALKVAKCGDITCTLANVVASTVDSTGNVGQFTSLAIGRDGLPVMSYRDFTNGALKVAKCGDITCTLANVVSTTVDSAGDVGAFTSLAVGSDGLPVIGYFDATNFDLKVAKCGDITCTLANVVATTVDSTGFVGYDTSLAIGSDSLPVMSYLDVSNGDLKVAKCGDITCTLANVVATTLDSTGGVGTHTSLAIGRDGLPVISYRDNTNGDLKVAACGDITCTPANVVSSTVDSPGDVGGQPSLAIGPDGLPVISYRDNTNGDLKVAKAYTATRSYRLDYGDGQAITGTWPASGVVPFTHTYSAAGSYTATLTATDGSQTTTATSKVLVLPPPPPLSTTLSNDGPTPLGKATHLTATLSPTAIFDQWRWVNRTVDSTGDVGTHTSLAIGRDGLPIMSYLDNTNGDLKAAKCGDITCTLANVVSTVDSTGAVGEYSSLAIGRDGLPVIGYFDLTNFDLKVAKCGDITCTPANVVATTIERTQGAVGYHLSLAIGSDGLPVMSYLDGSTLDLKVAKCGDITCTLANVVSSTLDSTGAVGYDTSLAIGSDGLPVISYVDATNFDLKVAKCGDITCTPANVVASTIDSTGNVGQTPSLVIGRDGLPVISYFDNTNQDLKVAKCGDITCTLANVVATTVDSTGDVGYDPALVIGSDGLPVIGYLDNTNGALKVAKCGDITCTPANVVSTTLDSSGSFVGYHLSLAIGADGLPIMSYLDRANRDLKVAKAYAVTRSYRLDYGDGQAITGTWPVSGVVPFTHTYSAVGSYTATLTATDGSQTATATSIVNVRANRVHLPIVLKNSSR